MSKHEINCEIVRDVLPLYAENMASESTCKMVKEHLNECKDCREYLEELKTEVNIPADTEKSAFQNLKNKMYRKNIFKTGIIVSITVLLMFLAFIRVNNPVSVGYESLKNLEVTELTDGSVEVSADGYLVDAVVEAGKVKEDGSINAHISFKESYLQRFLGRECTKTVVIEPLDGDKVDRVYYYPGNEEGDVILYQSEDAEEGPAGCITMERLAVNYYLAITLFLIIVGIVLSFIFKNKRQLIWKINLLPISYFVSYLLVDTGLTEHYEINMVDVLLVTAILYGILYWIMEYVTHGRVNAK